jgi:hypothetical protein
LPSRRQVIKLILYALGLAGINLLVSVAAMLAVILFFFRGDPILAAVPAMMALPAIVLQPWFLVFFFLPGSSYAYAPLVTTVVTIVVYGWLNSSGILERPKRVLLRFKTRRMLAVAGGFVLVAVSVAIARYVDFPALNRGLPPSVQFLELNVTDSRYYCLGQFIDSSWAWQAHVSEAELGRLVERYSLLAVDRSEIPDEFHSMPPYWWHPSITERTRVLSTPDFPLLERGNDGWHALATWNPDDELLHVWIKHNF